VSADFILQAIELDLMFVRLSLKPTFLKYLS